MSNSLHPIRGNKNPSTEIIYYLTGFIYYLSEILCPLNAIVTILRIFYATESMRRRSRELARPASFTVVLICFVLLAINSGLGKP